MYQCIHCKRVFKFQPALSKHKNKNRCEVMESKKLKKDKEETDFQTTVEVITNMMTTGLVNNDVIVAAIRFHPALLTAQKSVTVQRAEEEAKRVFNKLEPIKAKTDKWYSAASVAEKEMLRSYSQLNPALAEVEVNGQRVAGQPAAYNLSKEDLERTKRVMLKRAAAIDYELLKRDLEPKKKAYELIIDNFKTVLDVPDTQETVANLLDDSDDEYDEDA